MNPIVSISGTSRLGNYTSRALGVVNEQLRDRGATVDYIQRRICPSQVLESRLREDEDARPWSTHL